MCIRDSLRGSQASPVRRARREFRVSQGQLERRARPESLEQQVPLVFKGSRDLQELPVFKVRKVRRVQPAQKARQALQVQLELQVQRGQLVQPVQRAQQEPRVFQVIQGQEALQDVYKRQAAT